MRVLLWLILFSLASVVQADEMRPGYVEIREVAVNTFDVLWKVPARGADTRMNLHLRFADEVEQLGEPITLTRSDAHVQRLRVRHTGGLIGMPITIQGLATTFTDVLLRLERLDGTGLTHRLTPAAPSYTIEANPGQARVAWTYTLLGVEHILLGVDHLLFVLTLLLIVVGWKKLAATITAFTIAHSITLVLATLDLVRVPGPPVEAVIALSIVFVAAEVIRSRQGYPGLTERAPWLVAFTFGLLHGFGFAGALSEVGLPQHAIPMALLTFNLGVELGQLLFVAAVLVVTSIARKFETSPPDWVCRVPAYTIGSLAAFWMIERTAAL